LTRRLSINPKKVEYLLNDGNLFLGTRYQDHAVGLYAFALTWPQDVFGFSVAAQEEASKAKTCLSALPKAELYGLVCPANTFLESSLLYSAAIERLRVFMSVEYRLPSLLNGSAQ
jgi:hypothetical protein